MTMKILKIPMNLVEKKASHKGYIISLYLSRLRTGTLFQNVGDDPNKTKLFPQYFTLHKYTGGNFRKILTF